MQLGLSRELLELGVLARDLAQPRGPTGLHAAESGAPLVEGRIAEATQEAQLLDWQAALGMLQKTDDLFVGASALLHVRSCSENGLC